ncbi:hypothetical protein QJU89_00135 [Pasteurella skyensis]|uniref:Lipoprotein n=1 Tax=Phocoenobacter skyensis TaxID=97481 RepID=A0AAJ6NZZ0_9PAST|nr:hypothetical protein [Pasteurella skyensis]MDP8161867.1 hypothetical protein [Pasteurella skyensis]MDP8172023.1 hypothetical protein [Pasteurella skyensis]MDP8176258.1 hypothetical protein [Pasteurella skyensis]MDP8178278.1 hypothetical protein [Pasteurella skyensis]MDP8182114.1 hypothetical protein [Pasteurella skyensis]
MKKLFITFTLLSLLLLTGCTGILWGEALNIHNDETTKIIGEDTIYAFGKTKASTEQVIKDSLVLMGNKYWYIISAKNSKTIFELLRAKLPKPFTIMGKGSLPIEITNKKGVFNSNFCLKYISQNKQEQNKLKQLQFKSTAPKQTIYTKCIDVTGKYFTTQQTIKPEYHFETPINVSLFRTETKTNIGGSRVVSIPEAVIYTPLALAGDIIILPLMVISSVFN